MDSSVVPERNCNNRQQREYRNSPPPICGRKALAGGESLVDSSHKRQETESGCLLSRDKRVTSRDLCATRKYRP